jgi:diguanylate cyclase (GGDEF)-like protein
MLRLAHYLSGLIGARRLIVVLGVLTSFALVVSLAITLVIMALNFMAGRANELDEQRTRQTVAGVLNAMRGNMRDTVRDYAYWDDAVRGVYGEGNETWLVENFGLSTENSPLFDTLFMVDENHKTRLAYKDGKPIDAAPSDYIVSGYGALVDELLAAGIKNSRELAAYVETRDGVAIMALSIVRPVSSDIAVPPGEVRVIGILRHIDDRRIEQIAENFLVPQLMLTREPPRGRDNVSLISGEGRVLAYFSWKPRLPGDLSYAQVRPLIFVALLGVAFFFALLVLTGVTFATRLKEDEGQARALAIRDKLSGLKNRAGLYAGLDDLMAQTGWEGSDVALLFIDLDGFKDVNDFYGHAVGDSLIRGISAGLQQLVPADAALARIGGDEFAVAFCSKDALDDVDRLADIILRFFSEPFSIGDRIAVVGASIGIAISPLATVSGEELLRRADVAMYRAKQAGRGRAMHYESLMDEHRHDRREMEEALRAAVEREEIDVVFQPVVAARDRSICGVEVLARWYRAGRERVTPDVFIPLAEATGVIDALGLLVLRRGCEAARAWPQLGLSVNVSPAQFRNPYFPDQALSIIAESGIDPGRVTLEITEGYFIQNPSRARQVMERLKAGGVRLALDDFGAGFSSIGYLKQFGFDRMKIDRSLTVAAEQSDRGRAMLHATVALAESFEIPVTAEGVETEVQATFLELCGCDQLQGYYFGRPMVEKMLLEVLAAGVEDGARTAAVA